MYGRQYFIAGRIKVATFLMLKIFGLWPYKVNPTGHQTTRSFLLIIYSIFAPILMGFAYVYIGSALMTERLGGPQRAKVFASVPLQMIVIVYSYAVISSFLILHVGQHLFYRKKKFVYLTCEKVADFMREYRTESVDVYEFLSKYFCKTLVYDIINFSVYFYNLIINSETITAHPYLAIFIYLPTYSVRLNMNVFYGGILFFNVAYKQLNQSLNKIFHRRKMKHEDVPNLNFQFEKASTLYVELFRAVKAFNSLFTFQIALWFITLLLMLITQIFYQYIALTRLTTLNESYFAGENLAMLTAVCMTIYEVYTTTFACNSLVKEAEKTAAMIHQINSIHVREVKNVDIFSIWISLNKLNLNECGMFELDLKTFYMASTTILFYVVILMQFELTTKEINKIEM